ncbi:MAG: hypothetical protein OK404_03020 [Thaumarchaeota archaeon]|nr:hypothetical protein [Nitrososphaerota archaeon]
MLIVDIVFVVVVRFPQSGGIAEPAELLDMSQPAPVVVDSDLVVVEIVVAVAEAVVVVVVLVPQSGETPELRSPEGLPPASTQMWMLTDAPKGRAMSPGAGSLKKTGPDPWDVPIDARESAPFGGGMCIRKEVPGADPNGLNDDGAASL